MKQTMTTTVIPRGMQTAGTRQEADDDSGAFSSSFLASLHVIRSYYVVVHT